LPGIGGSKSRATTGPEGAGTLAGAPGHTGEDLPGGVLGGGSSVYPASGVAGGDDHWCGGESPNAGSVRGDRCLGGVRGASSSVSVSGPKMSSMVGSGSSR